MTNHELEQNQDWDQANCIFSCTDQSSFADDWLQMQTIDHRWSTVSVRRRVVCEGHKWNDLITCLYNLLKSSNSSVMHFGTGFAHEDVDEWGRNEEEMKLLISSFVGCFWDSVWSFNSWALGSISSQSVSFNSWHVSDTWINHSQQHPPNSTRQGKFNNIRLLIGLYF